MERIVLQVAGVRIVIRFHPTDRPIFKNALQNALHTHYGPFIKKKDAERADFTIHLVERTFLKTYTTTKGKRSVFSHLYDQPGTRRFTTTYHVSFRHLQFLVRTALVGLLATRRGFLLHASAVDVGGKAVLFTGRPGAGKSTAASLMGSSYPVLADDSGIIKKERGVFHFYQTPFIETNQVVKRANVPYPVSKLFFLRKSSSWRIERITHVAYILDRLAKQLWVDEGRSKAPLKDLFRFVDHIPCYFLYFGKDEEKLRELFDSSS